MSSCASWCPDCSPRNWCDYHRAQARRHQIESRIRRGKIRVEKCFRCLSVHPRGEAYCRLAAEWNGYPWRETDDGPPPAVRNQKLSAAFFLAAFLVLALSCTPRIPVSSTAPASTPWCFTADVDNRRGHHARGCFDTEKLCHQALGTAQRMGHWVHVTRLGRCERGGRP